MQNQTYLDCLMLMGTAVSLNLPEMNRPIIQEVFTTIVKLSLTIEDIILDDKNLILNLAVLLNQNWLDSRLGANIHTRQMAVSGKIWDPKITNVYGDRLDENLDETIFWRGYGDGNVTLNKKFKLRTYCSNYFRDFPFDTQNCEIKFGSYRFPQEEVKFEWNNQISFNNLMKTTAFRLKNITLETITDIRPTGNFSSAVVKLTIKRDPTHYLICIGVPCLIMVICSYLSLWTTSQKNQLNYLSVIVHLYFYYLSTCAIHPVPYLKRLDILVGLSMMYSLSLLIKSINFKKTKTVQITFSETETTIEYFKRNFLSVLIKISFPFFYLILILLTIY